MKIKYILALSLFVVIVTAIFLGVIPFVVIASLNTLFGLGIPYTIHTFVSVFCLYVLFYPIFIIKREIKGV